MRPKYVAFPVLFLLILLVSSAPAQIRGKFGVKQNKISSVVRDLNTHKEIGNVNIIIEGTQIGTVSSFTGKFTLVIPAQYAKNTIIFRHIAYERLRIGVDSLLTLRHVYLQPRVIQLQDVEIVEVGPQRMEITRDIPQPVSLVESREFEIRGYVDAGDLLRTDQSIQVEEELSGKKTVAIRGGNPDDVVVLYNGIKMNSNYDNVFDFSLIDLEDIARFEIIKGSNTSLYGPEAFSGVVNIVPKIQQDYTVRFQQRLGTYRSGNWGVHLYQKLKGLRGAYSFKQGGAKREFVDADKDSDQGLENKSTHHTANLSYSFAEHPDGRPANLLGAMWISTTLEYDNLRDNEFLENKQQMGSLKYTSESGAFKDFDVSFSHRSLDETQLLFIPGGELERVIEDRAFFLDVEKRFRFGILELLTSYQFQLADLDFTDRNDFLQLQQVGLESAKLKRQHHGFVSILKLKNELTSVFLRTFNMDLSIRHDRVSDEQDNPVLREGQSEDDLTGMFADNDWDETVFKFSVGLSGYRDYLTFNSYLNFGRNVKFPTLFQQISSPLSLARDEFQPNLSPEKNRSIEVGFNVTREFRDRPAVYGWSVSGNFFQNNYENKFRLSATPGIPVVFYDNVPDARITGIETKASLYLYRKKMTLQYGLSKYGISEKAAFPFKSDFKHIFDFLIDHAGYSFQLHWFREGAQVGWLRLASSATSQDPGSTGFGEIELPDYSNLDLHLSKKFEIANLKLFLNLSGRNLLNSEDVVLEGLAIRDRRFYVTMGAQY